MVSALFTSFFGPQLHQELPSFTSKYSTYLQERNQDFAKGRD